MVFAWRVSVGVRVMFSFVIFGFGSFGLIDWVEMKSAG